MQTSCPVDFHAIKGVSPVPPPSKVNHSTSWAGATVCEWQLVQLDPLVAKNTANSPVAGLGPPRQDWLIHLGAGRLSGHAALPTPGSGLYIWPGPVVGKKPGLGGQQH